jgi:hypothetical protein
VHRRDLDDASDEKEHVHRHHHRVVTATELLASICNRPCSVSSGDDELQQPFEADGKDQKVVHGAPLPAQKEQFEAEARPHRQHHSQ